MLTGPDLTVWHYLADLADRALFYCKELRSTKRTATLILLFIEPMHFL